MKEETTTTDEAILREKTNRNFTYEQEKAAFISGAKWLRSQAQPIITELQQHVSELSEHNEMLKEENMAIPALRDSILASEQIWQKLEDKLHELKSDERMTYETATVFANAPLALIQASIGAQIHVLESILGLPLSKFPLSKEEALKTKE